MGSSLEGPPALDEAPLRAELFSIGQLQRHALTLARWHELGGHAEPDRLLPRLSENERVLTDAYALLVAAVTRGRQITPAAEWFVDNYHLIEEQIRLARRHLPRGYLKELPRIVDGARGTPRAYALALELISHAHGRVDLAALRAFIASYQSVQPLQLGELWAIPIMLRLALIENLRRVVALVTAGRLDRERARTRANRLLEVGANDPSRVVLVLAEMIEDDPTLSHAFVAELASRIQGQGAAMVFPLAWLEQRLIDRGLTLERVFQLASQSQAADQVSVGNSIGSLRFLGATDWRHFVERASVVEQALRQDALYGEMDFATRDRYRHVVETIAREGPLSELAVAQAAVSLTAEDPAGRAGHVGYFLADEGRDRLEAEAGAVGPARRVARALRRARLPIYLGSIASISVAITIPLALQASTSLGGAGLALWVALVLLAASELAVSITHWAATWLAQPTLLPRLDFSEGIPSAHRTLVAVPTMLTSLESIDEIVAALEVRFLANRDPNLGLALVTDFRDAETETLESDAALLEHTCRAVEALRAKYASEPGGGLFLLHRARRWNPGEGVWMGWERKRGKLEDLNATLRGEEDRFARIVGPLAELQTMKYVIVLDTDTDLPRDAARALAATLGHPLNRPVFDPAKGRVTKGYAILQPRVGVTLASANASRFARLSVGDAGIDPYTRAVSNVYQDLFGEGSFVGKGIYDVDGVRQAITGRFPNDRILSHDLLEGAYARSALVSDILLFEDFPSSYLVDASRRARWIRGDWQIARWLFGRVPSLEGRAANPISMLSRWKILDNLRRSVVPASLVALLAFAWTIPGIGSIAFSLAMATLVIPNLLAALVALARRPADVARGEHVEDIVSASRSTLASDILRLAWLPHDAVLGAMAIGRAAVRVLITRQHLLEWRTAADAQRAKAHTLAATYLALWVMPASALAAIALLVHRESFPYADTPANPQALALAAPVIALWAIAPTLVWWVSRPIVPRSSPLSTADTQFLRGVARRTWRFFDTYVAPEDNHLPPDNVQEYANVGVAHRTSPTNIGMALLANLAAYDFGHVLADEVVDRTTKTFATMERLERFRGHFYNWYDTRTLEPLRPLYVSSVDSGNLAGHLLTLAAGLEEMAADSLLRHELLEGLDDTLTLIVEAAASEDEAFDVDAARALLSTRPETNAQWRRLLEELEPMTAALESSTQGEPHAELATWTRALDAQCKRMRLALETGTRDDDEAPATLDSLGYTGRLRALAVQSRALAEQDYDFLYDPSRRLLAIGYNVAEHRLDASFYDLLASEARLASFVAIALGKLPQEHWFSLGRLLTTSGGRPTLLSWSGSMFEYLMPLLVMPAYPGTLLDATYRAVVARQIDYGREHGVPWGVSESGFSETDAHLNYQYRAFGVPGLGFKRGLANDLVVTPHACALGLMVDPAAACANLRRLAAEERLGGYGFYEAIDYTASRMPPDQTSVTVRSYMAHHQGMTFLALAYQLLGKPMQRRFEADASLRATLLLLQERVPKAPPIHPHPAELSTPRPVATSQDHGVRVIATPAAAFPHVHLLSNGEYHVAVTNAGGGYSRWRDLAVTRWVEDPTRDCWGSFVYVRDLATGSFWSVTHQPTLREAVSYEAIFSQGRAEFRRRDEDLTTHVEISVSPEDDIELRRITLSNLGSGRRTIELTSFAEVVLTQAATDASHRTFSNLFVQTEILRTHRAILCTRRPRSGGETPPWMFHLMTVHGESKGETSYETDRASFIGRARTAADPAAMYRPRLDDGEGAVLDPIVAIRNVVQIEPDETIQVHVVTGVAETREGAIALIEKYVDRHVAGRVLELAWTQSHVVQRRLGATSADTLLYERLAANVLYMNPALRAPSSVLVKNRLGQSGLWPYGISGDLPIALVRIAEGAHLELVRQMVSAHAYWRAKGLLVDLVVWNDDPSGYRQDLQEEILRVIAGSADAALIDRPGGIFVRRGDHMSEDDSVLVQTVARLIVKGGAGTLAEQLERRPHVGGSVEEFVPGGGEGRRARGERRRPPAGLHSAFPIERRRAQENASPNAVTARADLVSWNGHGGFTRDGREYVIVTTREERTPLPWVNVIANPYFGTVVSESGGAYTWCENAHSYRLTPWGNDPVSDVSGEAMYVRDEDDGRFWSPTPLPCGGVAPYTTRHGFGYTAFETDQAGIASELRTFVATDAPVKFLMLQLRNTSGRRRRLSLTATFDLVLGSQRPESLPHVVTDVDPRTGALFAQNSYAAEFAPRVAFLDSSETVRTVTGDRHELLGQNGDPAQPAFMQHARLSGRMGTGLDPCLAMQVSVDLADGQTREVAFMFGSGRDEDDARHIVERFQGVGGAQRALDQVWASWKRTLSAVRVETPDPGLDHLANGWLVYQVLASRMWGRSGFYQSGGAYGFRDQLQDAMALLHAEPAVLREQLLRAAARQFPQGDVQHWWHPPLGRGVRTRISDDYLWLPYAVCRYVTGRGDTGVLDEPIDFIEGRAVEPGEDSYYDLPTPTTESATLYTHCVRAIQHGLRFGEHGLPLMGSGDWNDGMNLVGDEGRGESVWLAFFLHDVLVQFGALARARGDDSFADECDRNASTLAANIEAHGWDGAWYRRAYFDDGTPLGSESSPECQIDSLPQSWAMLTGVGGAERARAGLAAVDARLVDRELGVIKLFDPPFDHSALEPGYVKGYVPGVRENGGQYTHAAVWTTMAFAAAGQIDKAWELFDLINPTRHGKDATSIATYKVEPYVVAADVYTNPQHAGRGGWTWYTGSAGWMYRLVLESLLGLRLEIDRLHVAPRLPAAWEGFTVHYRHGDTMHHIEVKRTGPGDAVTRVTCDGVPREDRSIELRDDREEHWAIVEVGG